MTSRSPIKLNVSPQGYENLSVARTTFVAMTCILGEYPDAADRPGSSALKVGTRLLFREDVACLATHLINWLETGLLSEAKK